MAVVRRIHRTLGAVFGLTLIVAALSGILHQVMSRTQAPPPKPRPHGTVDLTRLTFPLSGAVQRLGASAGQVRMVSVRTIEGRSWYQFLLEDAEKPVYLDAEDGTVGTDADERYARDIARLHLGPEARIRYTAYLTEYDTEYLNIFRILPVYRFDAEDGRGTRVYVSTMTGSVTRHTDDAKQWEAWVFSNFHKYQFIKHKDLRDGALITATAGAAAAAIYGLVLLAFTLRRR
ncbi:MAG: hypothetical protein MOGMAGMI_02098 [Candidatus Omnitrophica bacterium]|nr:hypothetical protein [Candidatus Omnitrophota bacterium]